MKCPHCLTSFHDAPETTSLGEDDNSKYTALHQVCPECRRKVIVMVQEYDRFNQKYFHRKRQMLIFPAGYTRQPVPSSVGQEFAADYREACSTLVDSPKASAALSRRCLQHILREMAGVKKPNLAQEIQEVIDSKTLPSYISESLDAVRNIGNFAAHPMKSTHSGEILEVEPGEAEWNLDVIESLFDFYFVQPDLLAKKRAALDAKLASAGKPPMKTR